MLSIHFAPFDVYALCVLFESFLSFQHVNILKNDVTTKLHKVQTVGKFGLPGHLPMAAIGHRWPPIAIIGVQWQPRLPKEDLRTDALYLGSFLTTYEVDKDYMWLHPTIKFP